MGSVNVPLCISYGEVMVNNWEIIGNFMYPNSAYRRLLDLVRTGMLPLDAATVTAFSLPGLLAAIEAAARNRGLQCTLVAVG
jgi:alcohol dehydrogenase